MLIQTLSLTAARAGLKRDASWTRFVAQWAAIGFTLHIIASARSAGFHDPTEQTQLLELVAMKLGKSMPADLVPEFQAKTLPWLQASLYTIITSFLNSIGVRGPLDWAQGFRLISTLSGWLAVTGLSLCSYIWIPDRKWRQWTVIFLTLTWYLPSLHARHSGPSLGGSFFAIGLSWLLLNCPPHSKADQRPSEIPPIAGWIGGGLLGLAIQFHFGIGWMVLGLLAWLLIIAHIKIKEFASILVGLLLPFLLGALADRWGYGEWTFPLANVISQKLSTPLFGPGWGSDWSVWIQQIVFETWPLLGVFLLGAFLVGIARQPKHVLSWCSIPLLLVFAVFGPRELRFLHPLTLLAPVLVIFAVFSPLTGEPEFGSLWKNKRNLRIAEGIVALNLIALLATSTVPAWLPIRFYAHLQKYRPYGFEIHFVERNPFMINAVPVNFYRPEGLKVQQLANYDELVAMLKQQERPTWLFRTNSELPSEPAELKHWCKVDYAMLPAWIGNLASRRWLVGAGPNPVASDSAVNWTLFKCQGPDLMKSTLTAPLTE